MNIEKYKALEEWRDTEYQGYQVSNLGRVRRIPSLTADKNGKITARLGGIIKASDNGKGYEIVNVSINGVVKSVRVNRLVAIAFIPNPENKPQVNHIDGFRDNNCVYNLEWCTAKENINHAMQLGKPEPKSKQEDVTQLF